MNAPHFLFLFCPLNMTFESICEELDSLALSYLNLLNEYTHQWKDTGNEFQQVKRLNN